MTAGNGRGRGSRSVSKHVTTEAAVSDERSNNGDLTASVNYGGLWGGHRTHLLIFCLRISGARNIACPWHRKQAILRVHYLKAKRPPQRTF